MAWWESNHLRLIQNNLREIDANLDVDLLMAELKRFSVNTLMMNAGGIVAFYPTKLPYHYRAKDQNKDLLKEAVEKAHANGMRFIARFDFSKVHEQFLPDHPEWFYRTAAGETVNYHGIVHTCVNGEYQRELSLTLIDEVISNYGVDGIFFNMFGYQTRDYSGNYYGICHCENCKRRFQAFSGHDLPASEDWTSEVYRKYKEFQELTTKDMLTRIRGLVKSKTREIAISTYHTHGVDIVRKESNTAIGRPHPVWQYSASENVKSIEDAWSDKLISNCCINAIDLPYRFVGVSKHEVAIRLYESIASGSGLDFCIIGVFDGYPDRANFDTVEEIFRFHREHEAYYGQLQSLAEIALVCPSDKNPEAQQEYRGLFKMLKEAHMLFDVIHQDNLEHPARAVASYRAVWVPDVRRFTPAQLEMLAEARRNGVGFLATGLSFTGDEANRRFLQDILGVEAAGEDEETYAAYFDVSDKALFKRFPERDWIVASGPFRRVRSSHEGCLPFILPSTFGPPERASGHRLSDCSGAHLSAEARIAYVPWQAGTLYYQHGYEDYKHVLLDIADHAVPTERQLVTNAPQNVEIFLNRVGERAYLLQLLNLSGFNGVSYQAPYRLTDLKVRLPGLNAPSRVWNLATGQPAALELREGSPDLGPLELNDYLAIVIEQ